MSKGLARLYMYFLGGLFVLAIILFALGGAIVPETSFEVAGCRGEWSTSPVQLSSDLCPEPGQPCTAQPEQQQHNAIVDALVCACESVSGGGNYPNAAANGQIEEAFEEASGTQFSVREICESGGGGFMTRWRYS